MKNDYKLELRKKKNVQLIPKCIPFSLHLLHVLSNYKKVRLYKAVVHYFTNSTGYFYWIYCARCGKVLLLILFKQNTELRPYCYKMSRQCCNGSLYSQT